MKRTRIFALLSALFALGLLAPSALHSQPPKQDRPPERKKSTVDDDDDKPATKPAEKPADAPKPAAPPPEPEKPIQGVEKGPFNLAEEADKAAHPEVKAFLKTYAKPADVIFFKSAQAGVKEIAVDPLPKRFDPNGLANINFSSVDGGKKGTFAPSQIEKIDHYEQRALAGVRRFLDSGLDKPDATGKPAVSRFEMLRAAEKVLFEAHSFHGKAKEIKQRADGWDGVQQALEKELAAAQVGEVRALTADADWGTAQALSARLYGERPGDRELLSAIETLHVNQANHLLDTRKDYFQARKTLEQLKTKFKIELPFDAKAQRRLVDHARERFEEAKKLIAEGKKTDAQKLLEEAAQAWPTLAGLDMYIKSGNQEYAVLRVGVRHLPTQFAPVTAASDIDRIASRLVFDPVLQIRYGPMQREGYLSKLGDEPRRTEQGWELEIPDYLKWNDGTPVTSADFLRSAELFATPNIKESKFGSPLYDADAADLLAVSAPDQKRVLFSFKRACVDPLAYLAFDLLPAHRLPSDRSPRDQAFGKAPVGTGPFIFEKMDGDEMVFLANPHYRRPWAPDGPSIKEIRFIRYTDFSAAKQALADGRWQMVLDLSTAEKEELTGLPATAVITPTETKNSTLPSTLDNPRIYFLGFNYRKPAFQNENVRRAIGLAVDRNAILASAFRGKGRPYHQVLTGPYPNGTWAVPKGSPAVQGYQMSEATRLMNDAKSGAGVSSVSLSYAEEDLSAAKACEEIKANLDKLGITVNLKGMPAVQLQNDLNSDRPTFDLVYAHYDFPNEMLSLWPMFDPSSATPQGKNFMGDCKDTALIGVFRSMQNKRDLSFIELRTHGAYNDIWRKMHFVPLWQLDPHIAVHRSLEFTRIHPTHVFEDVEKWKLRKE